MWNKFNYSTANIKLCKRNKKELYCCNNTCMVEMRMVYKIQWIVIFIILLIKQRYYCSYSRAHKGSVEIALLHVQLRTWTFVSGGQSIICDGWRVRERERVLTNPSFHPIFESATSVLIYHSFRFLPWGHKYFWVWQHYDLNFLLQWDKTFTVAV